MSSGAMMPLAPAVLVLSALLSTSLAIQCHDRSLEQVPTGQYVPPDTPYARGPDTCHEPDRDAKCVTVLVADKTWYRWHKEKEPELVLVPTTVKQTCCNSASSNDWYCNPSGPPRWHFPGSGSGPRHTQAIAGGQISVHCEATAKGFIRKKIVFTCTSDMCELPRHMWDQVSNDEHWQYCDDLIRERKPQRYSQQQHYNNYENYNYDNRGHDQYDRRPRRAHRARKHRRSH